ncbi:MAG: sensor histidine kinase [Bryobacteraceae bacterium]
MPTDKTPFVETHMLRGLIAGLGLVILLLGAAGVVAVQGTRAIEDDTARVVREQLVMARLLNAAQAGQNMLAAVLHQLSRAPETADEHQLLKDLETADNALDRVAQSASATPEARQWNALHQAERSFSTGVRESIKLRATHAQDNSLRQLFVAHDAVVKLEQELLEASELRVADTERRIEDESRQLAARSVLLLGSCLTLALLCAVLTVIFARKSIRNLEWHAHELGRVSWHMLQSQEETARRFSHELHDELGQSLAAVRANLTSTHSSGSAKEWEHRREDCVQLVDSAIANVRELSQLLRPVILDDFGLDASLRWLTERFSQRTNIRVDYKSSFHSRLPDETETHLFRIAQEAFTNIARHSGASEVEVVLSATDGTVKLAIVDNGRGLSSDDEQYSPTLGMTGMRARARQAGGKFRTARPPGGGLMIEVQVPQGKLEEIHAS